MTAKQISRLQNCIIALLTLSAVFLFASLPLFGALSDRSLVELAWDRFRREASAPSVAETGAAAFSFPVRIVYAGGFSRAGADAITTVSDEFERAGAYLGEALGSAYGGAPIREAEFLAALGGEGLYFDFAAALTPDLLSGLLGVSAPETALPSVRRVLLSPSGTAEVALYVQDGAGESYRFSTAASGAALSDFLAAHGGNGADFAFLLGEAYEQLSPYTLILTDPAPRGALTAANALLENEDAFLRRAEFNAHTENRFTESSGTVIVREASSALYLRPDGTVDYQGGAVGPESLYFVASADGAPTLSEATAAAQALVAALTQDLLGDAALYLSGAREDGGGFEIDFDLMADGTPLRFSDGSHAATVAVEGQYITAFTLKARSYTLGGEDPLLLPFAQAAAIARVWDGAELFVAYVDTGAESVLPAWIAE